ncbi:MAG: amidohydrolase [Deltaproteobacteria bacterium]|nr:amidohydrolase [Deltaproteobacteria bacterium]
MSKPWVFTNGNIITMHAPGDRAQALACEGSRIVAVGSNADVQNFIDRGWPVLDMAGQTVLPGFIDTHEHMMLTGLMAAAVHLDDVENIEQLLEKIGRQAEQTPKGVWIRGSYLNEQNLAEKRMPDRTDLDRVCPDHPVFLLHATCHMCSLNTTALELINLPPALDGVDRVSGQPTGVVRDPGILTFVHPVMSSLVTEAEKIEFLQKASRMALDSGITTLHALDGGDLGPGDTKVIWANRDQLPLRIVCYNQSMDLSEVKDLGLPRVGGCICSDGAFEAHTAALFEPYADDPDNYGELTYSQPTMDEFIRQANRAGLQIAVHCESERSIEQVLWAMEKALRDFPRADHRHRIEHLELPTFNQIERMAKAGIMTGMQPAFIPAFIGRHSMELYAILLGTARLNRVHPYRTILDHGIPICGGSDSPVTPYDPLAGIQAAVNHPNTAERVTLHEALAMFTATAAWSAFEEKEKGTIEPGKLADLVVLSADPFAVDAAQIAGIKINQVYAGGIEKMNIEHRTSNIEC